MISGAVSFFVEGLPPSPNATRRRDWHQNAGQARGWKDAALMSLHEATGGRWSPMTSCRIDLVLVASTARRRDPDNVAASAKPVIDALVLAGLIPDDSFAVVRELRVRTERGPVTGLRVEVHPA